jgi:CPA2 family monovalent cation:H+ antiporter-2
MEMQFESGFQADLKVSTRSPSHDRLAPWDAHLVEVRVPARSFLVGRSLQDLALRENYGLNVVVIVRDGENTVAPKATEPLYPGDHILCFATDAEIERFKDDIDVKTGGGEAAEDLESFDLKRLTVQGSSPFKGVPIKTSGFREKFDCIVVGLERGGQRTRSPKSDVVLSEGDVLLVVGERKKLQALAQAFC